MVRSAQIRSMRKIKLMKHLKIGFIVLFLASVPNVQAGEVSFRYGFIGKQGTGAETLVVIEAGATLHSGDPLKLNFEHSKGTWFYICYRSTLDEYALLYSAKGRKSQQSEVAFGTLGWLALDQNIGEENFILIASEKRLKKLEKATTAIQRGLFGLLILAFISGKIWKYCGLEKLLPKNLWKIMKSYGRRQEKIMPRFL